MPLVDLQPGEVIGVGHKLPRGRSVVFRVEANREVNTYIVDEPGWGELRVDFSVEIDGRGEAIVSADVYQDPTTGNAWVDRRESLDFACHRSTEPSVPES